jgi:hypothetical protein
MSEVVTCPECQRRLSVPPELVGRNVKCPTCGANFSSATEQEPPTVEYKPPTADYPPPPADDDLEWRVRRDMAPHRGGMVLTFGILGLVLALPSICCLFMAMGGIGFSITAWVMGHADLRAMREKRMDPEGRGSTHGGWVCGILGTIFNVGVLLLHIAAGIAQFALTQ